MSYPSEDRNAFNDGRAPSDYVGDPAVRPEGAGLSLRLPRGDDKRGGDIDLLIFSELLEDKNIPLLKVRLYERLGEEKIDIVLARDQRKPFVRIALSEAVEL